MNNCLNKLILKQNQKFAEYFFQEWHVLVEWQKTKTTRKQPNDRKKRIGSCFIWFKLEFCIFLLPVNGARLQFFGCYQHGPDLFRLVSRLEMLSICLIAYKKKLSSVTVEAKSVRMRFFLFLIFCTEYSFLVYFMVRLCFLKIQVN